VSTFREGYLSVSAAGTANPTTAEVEFAGHTYGLLGQGKQADRVGFQTAGTTAVPLDTTKSLAW
jgi:hypothetical protein